MADEMTESRDVGTGSLGESLSAQALKLASTYLDTPILSC